jgi:hypothetical protein
VKGFKVEIQGLSRLQKKLDGYDKELTKEVDKQLTIGAKNVEMMAVRLAPAGKSGRLKASIYSDTARVFDKSVGSHLPYAPYVEFGTGVNVFKGGFKFTAEMKAYAREFYVSGKGFRFPTPYLFPALETEKRALIKRIRNEVFQLNKV